MERTLVERIIFISVFFTIIFSMHLYSFVRLSSLFGIERKAWHYVILFFLATSIIYSTILSNISHNPATRILYIFAACWFGVQFLFFSAVLIYEIPRLFIRTGGPLADRTVPSGEGGWAPRPPTTVWNTASIPSAAAKTSSGLRMSHLQNSC